MFEVFSPGTSSEIWLNHESFLAPCQCFVLAGITMTLPGSRLTAFLPSSWYQPWPAVQIRIWPPPLSALWICQWFLQPGSKVTFARKSGESASTKGLRKELPSKYGAYASFAWPFPKIFSLSKILYLSSISPSLNLRSKLLLQGWRLPKLLANLRRKLHVW